MANLSAIKLPNGTTYNLKDNGALQLTGGQVTGPVTFGDSVEIDNLTAGQLVVNGNASFTNNIQANTINGVAVGSNPKFTDTNTHNTAYLYAGASNGTANAATTNGNTYLILMDGGSATTRRKISGSGATTVTSDASGNIVISSTDTNTHNTYTISNSGSGNAVTAVSLSGTTFTVTKGSTFLLSSDIASWAKASSKPTYTASEVGALASSTKYAGSSSAGGAANSAVLVNGTYSGNGGAQPPSFVSGGQVKFAMMNNPKGLTGFPTYADTIIMDTYTGNDVPWTTGLGIIKQDANPRMFIFNGAKGNTTTWKNIAEVLTTKNWTSSISIPTATDSKTTGITASTTATKTTLGTAFTIPNVTSAGSASTWAFEEVSIPNVTSAGSASTWAFEDIACDDITSWSAGNGSASISGAVDSNDSTQLNITISHTHTAPSLQYTARTVSSKKSGANGTAPTLGTAIKVQSKKSGGNGSAPTLGTAFTVPNVTGNTSATVSVTDPGHTHSI